MMKTGIVRILKRCVGIFLFAIILSGIGSASSEAAVLLQDSFDSGINDATWWRETINGVQWQWSSSGQDIYSQDTGKSNRSNRYLDIFTTKNDFTNFILTCDMKFNNEGNNQDYRAIYLRANYAAGNDPGYWIVLQNWSGSSSDNLSIASFNSDQTMPYFASALSPLDVNVWYRFKIEVDGNQIDMKYWDRDNGSEPSDWLLTATDPNNYHSIGQIGFGNYWSSSTEIDNVKVEDTTVVPEPASMALIGMGLFGLAGLRKRK